MKFKEYLSKRKVTYDASGDFVAEALADPRIACALSWPELEALVGKRHGFNTVEAARAVWRDYEEDVRGMEKLNAKESKQGLPG